MTYKTSNAANITQLQVIKRILALASVSLFLAGCASTENERYGAMGNDSETSTYQQNSVPANPDSAPGTSTAPGGANGSISRKNPFGLGDSGLTKA